MKQTEIPYKMYLGEEEMPKFWYNIKPLMRSGHAPLFNPATLQPCAKEELSQIFLRGMRLTRTGRNKRMD